MADIKKTLIAIVALLGAGALSLWAGFAQAHDGPHGPRVLAQSLGAKVTGTEVSLDLMLTGLEPVQRLAISGVFADDAAVAPLATPVPVGFAEDVVIPVRLQFEEVPPGIFTLGIDFGAAGQGGAVVIPEPAKLQNAFEREEG